jgi:hypothetical protein
MYYRYKWYQTVPHIVHLSSLLVLGMKDAFHSFIHAVFYVGKGKRSRPYEHFKEAMTLSNKDGKVKVVT